MTDNFETKAVSEKSGAAGECIGSKAINVGGAERAVSILLGAVLAGNALTGSGLKRALSAVGGGALLWRGLSGKCPLYGALGADTSGARSDRLTVSESITVDTGRDELFHFWRDFRNLSRIFPQLELVKLLDERTSRWRWQSVIGAVDWDAEISALQQGELIAWRSLPNSKLANDGFVHFVSRPGRQTEVKLHIELQAPLIGAASSLLRYSGHSLPREIKSALHRLQQIMEAGEKATTDGQPHGPRRSWSIQQTNRGRA